MYFSPTVLKRHVGPMVVLMPSVAVMA